MAILAFLSSDLVHEADVIPPVIKSLSAYGGGRGASLPQAGISS